MAGLVGCSEAPTATVDADTAEGTALVPRTYRMGFSAAPPVNDEARALETITMWASRADAALLPLPVPWVELLRGTPAPELVRRHLVLDGVYRQLGLSRVVSLEVADGWSRDREAPALLAMGRSLADADVQRVYAEFVSAVDSILEPDYLGLALETNLLRVEAGPRTYDAIVAMTNEAARRLERQGSTAALFVSVQAETAWGLVPDAGAYVGIERDLADFAFIHALGVSTYPFLAGFAAPEEVPVDYLARLVGGRDDLPVLVVESGWPSTSVSWVVSDPALQARWVRHLARIADAAPVAALMQIAFTDFDLDSYAFSAPDVAPLFARLGLVDTALRPKPALRVWDRVFGRIRRPMRD